MKLYMSPGACSMSVHIGLEEAGLKYTTEAVNLGTGHYKGGEFTKITPKGYVPALELDSGEVLTECAVILQWIGDQVPEKKLLPKAGTMERVRCQEWMNYVATEIHKGFGPLWDDRVTDKTNGKADLAKKFDFLSEHLAKRSFLMGDAYTLADSYLFTILGWTFFLKYDLAPWPALQSYVGRVRERTAVRATMDQEGIGK
jgi:glutathione S-transferase